MPVDKKLKHEQLKGNSAAKLELKAKSFGNRGGKAQGTRFGTLTDWREGSSRTGESVGRYGRVLRDGR
ncbi:MAG TPA: hypothetical protein VJM50_13465 [Pyrinomonadaceae bacterium]|nr:hypothetical protein [Pyrinomonadaceae bacterium]